MAYSVHKSVKNAPKYVNIRGGFCMLGDFSYSMITRIVVGQECSFSGSLGYSFQLDIWQIMQIALSPCVISDMGICSHNGPCELKLPVDLVPLGRN